MIKTKGYAALQAKESLQEWAFERREPGDNDVLIDIAYCGVCHSDIHQVRSEWGDGLFPMVPGHEIVGTVSKVGKNVKKFKIGDHVGVGCMVDSCNTCIHCKDDLEQYCSHGFIGTYNSYEKDGKSISQGGYSKHIVVTENFVLNISGKLDLKRTAPLLCAGITTYSPLRHWKVGKGMKVAVLGLGGLGHMGVKFAVAMGAEVTVLSTSANKEADAKALGAHHFINTKDDKQFSSVNNHFDFILNTVSASIDLNGYLNLLRRDGTMVMVGISPDALQVSPFSLVMGRRTLAGSLIGGIKETQEMLDFCAQHNIVSDIEMINMRDINTAYTRMLKSDVKYRFVIDIKNF